VHYVEGWRGWISMVNLDNGLSDTGSWDKGKMRKQGIYNWGGVGFLLPNGTGIHSRSRTHAGSNYCGGGD
jgi:hypothetical protein